jgi:hypothetical protein
MRALDDSEGPYLLLTGTQRMVEIFSVRLFRIEVFFPHKECEDVAGLTQPGF